MKDSEVEEGVVRGNLLAMHIRQDCKSATNQINEKVGSQKVKAVSFFFTDSLNL